MIFLLILIALLTLFVIFGTFFYIIPSFFGAAYEGSDRKTIEKMIRISGNLKGKKIVDIGSGDGRIIIEFAEKGAKAEGYEINPLLVLFSRYKIKKLNLQKKAKINYLSFWKTNLNKYDIVVTFPISYLMKKLEKKIKKECKKGTIILSNKWEFEHFKLIKRDGRVKAYRV